MSSKAYQLNATNSTAEGWFVGLYQKPPQQLGLKSLAWKVLALSKPQPNPTTGSIPWTLTYQVTVPETHHGDFYKGQLTVSAKMGYKYELYMSGEFQQIKEIGKGTDGYIDFYNNTETAENLAFMVDGSIMAMQSNVPAGTTAQFQITPTYYCGLFSDVKEGSFVSSDVVAGTPLQIKFQGGDNTAQVGADIKGGQVTLSGPSYSFVKYN